MNNIHLCVTHDKSQWSRIWKYLHGAGFPMSDTRITQVACGHDDEIKPERMRSVIEGIDNAEGDIVDIDWENRDHEAYTNLNTDRQILTKRTMADRIRKRGKRAGIWAPISFNQNSKWPVSQSSLDNYAKLKDHFDVVIGEAYMATDFWEIDDPDDLTMRRYMAGLTLWYIETRKLVGPDMPIIVAFQLHLRKKNDMFDMSNKQAQLLGQILASLNCEYMFWFEQADEEQQQMQFDTVDRLGRSFLKGFGSVGIKGVDDD